MLNYKRDMGSSMTFVDMGDVNTEDSDALMF